MHPLNILDGLTLALLGVCVVVWPTQLISDDQNRWLRIAAIALTALQLMIQGPRLHMLPAQLVAALFALLLFMSRDDGGETSRVRESKESRTKKLARWSMVLGCGAALLLSLALGLLYPPSPGLQ